MLATDPSPSRLTDRLAEAAHRLRRTVLARRRMLAFALVGVAVLAGLHATASPAPKTVSVTVAATDLPTGVRLRPADLRTEDLPRGAVPRGRVVDPAGRMLAGPVRRGEPITDVRLVGAALTSGLRGSVTVPVRFPDADMVGLLHVGDRIDVISADPQGGEPVVLVRDCPVLAIPDPSSTTSLGVAGGSATGRLVVLAIAEDDVPAVAAAAVSHFLTFAFSG